MEKVNKRILFYITILFLMIFGNFSLLKTQEKKPKVTLLWTRSFGRNSTIEEVSRFTSKGVIVKAKDRIMEIDNMGNLRTIEKIEGKNQRVVISENGNFFKIHTLAPYFDEEGNKVVIKGRNGAIKLQKKERDKDIKGKRTITYISDTGAYVETIAHTTGEFPVEPYEREYLIYNSKGNLVKHTSSTLFAPWNCNIGFSLCGKIFFIQTVETQHPDALPGEIIGYDTETGEELWRLEPADKIVVSPRGKYIITSVLGKKTGLHCIRFYKEGKLIKTINGTFPLLHLSPDGNYILTEDKDDNLLLFRTEDAELLQKYEIKDLNASGVPFASFSGPDISRDGKYIITEVRCNPISRDSIYIPERCMPKRSIFYLLDRNKRILWRKEMVSEEKYMNTEVRISENSNFILIKTFEFGERKEDREESKLYLYKIEETK